VLKYGKIEKNLCGNSRQQYAKQDTYGKNIRAYFPRGWSKGRTGGE
jgi:hypothetical protein